MARAGAATSSRGRYARLKTGTKTRFASLANTLKSWLRAIGRFFKKIVRFFTGETQSEEPKSVIDKGFGRALLRSSVHLLPLLATAVLAALNLIGFFVGSQLTGFSDPTSQALYRLLLQITAKLYELLIVASLTTILWDVLRGELFSGSDGLPFGLVSAPRRFVELQFFISPSFWYGHQGIRRRRMRISIFLLLVAAGAIALFAGPSSALLMVPQEVKHWDGGGATIQLVGSNETLWPVFLDKWPDSIPRSQGEAPLNSSSRICIECDAAPIAQALKSWKYGAQYFSVDISDGYVKRAISVIRTGLGGSSDTWAISPQTAPCVYAKLLADQWHYSAMFNAPKANGLRSYRNYRYRDSAQTTSAMEMEVPMVRTSCGFEENVAFASIGESRARYRMQPDLGPTDPRWLWVSPTGILPFTGYYNDSSITTKWFVPPTNLPKNIDPVSSAYLNIQVPNADSSTEGTIIECSIDARWAHGTVVGSKLAWWPGGETFNASVRAGSLEYPSSGFEFPAVEGINWRRIRFGQEWLDTLTPAIKESHPGYTTLSAALLSLGLNETFNIRDDWNVRTIFVQAVISALVVNGIAQVGYDLNGGGKQDLDNLMMPGNPSDLDALLDGDLVLPTLANMIGREDQKQPQTSLQWHLMIAGFAYKADSTAYYLALVVVFTHAILAIGHTAWLYWRRTVSTAWETHHDMLALAINSQPTSELSGTSGGVKCLKRLQRPVRVRELSPGPRGSTVQMFNELQLTIGDEDKMVASWKDVKAKQKYT